MSAARAYAVSLKSRHGDTRLIEISFVASGKIQRQHVLETEIKPTQCLFRVVVILHDDIFSLEILYCALVGTERS